MPKIEKLGSDPNYYAKVVSLPRPLPHPNADRLQVVTVDRQPVITDAKAEEGDLYVYFPVDSALDERILRRLSLYRDSTLNQDPGKTGFFDPNGRVKAAKIRGVISQGFILPADLVFALYSLRPADLSKFAGEYFDSIDGVRVSKKYVPPKPSGGAPSGGGKVVRGRSRMFDGQVRLHVDTLNLRRSHGWLTRETDVSITEKLHGTSFSAQHVLVKRALSLLERLAVKIGIDVRETEYDVVATSRRVIKGEYQKMGGGDYYKHDLYAETALAIADVIPKGFAVYGEIVGYVTGSTQMIQKGYDYGCAPGENRLFIYRVSAVNPEGVTVELTRLQVEEFCSDRGLTPVPLLYRGRAGNFSRLGEQFPDTPDGEDAWREAFLDQAEAMYASGKDCRWCRGKVPSEGCVVVRETSSRFDAHKLKSAEFVLRESGG